MLDLRLLLGDRDRFRVKVSARLGVRLVSEVSISVWLTFRVRVTVGLWLTLILGLRLVLKICKR